MIRGGVDKQERLRQCPTVKEHPIHVRELFTKDWEKQLTANMAHLFPIRRKPLPIIFVPGLMGSRLSKDNKNVWDPDDSVESLVRALRMEPRDRFKVFAENPTSLEIVLDDKEHNEKYFSIQYPHGVERGWGGVYWSSYGSLLKALDDWETPLKLFLDIPVYAFPYNWMLSNLDNAKKLKGRIAEIKDAHDAEQVILVTHSMGGLVARAASHPAMGNMASSIAGIVHGAQPALGAVDTYMRMKAGQWAASGMEKIMELFLDKLISLPKDLALGMIGGPIGAAASSVGVALDVASAAGKAAEYAMGLGAAKIIGNNGAAVSAVLYHSKGGLELLPFDKYFVPEGKQGSTKQWLHVLVQDGTSSPIGHGENTAFMPHYKCLITLPEHDPYADIYTKTTRNKKNAMGGPDFWSLINEEWVYPTTKKGVEEVQARIEEAKKFHSVLDGGSPYAHPRTIQLFNGTERTYCEAIWKCDDVTDDVIKDFYTSTGIFIHGEGHYSLTPDEQLAKRVMERYYNKNGRISFVLKSEGPLGETFKTDRYSVLSVDELFNDGLKYKSLYGDKPHLTPYKYYQCTFLEKSESIHVASEGKPSVDLPNIRWGDGTVPVESGRGLEPGIKAWGNKAQNTLNRNIASKNCTYHVGSAEHQSFFDDNGIKATLNAIHNIARQWLEDHMDDFDSSPLECNLSCMRSDDDPHKVPDKSAERV